MSEHRLHHDLCPSCPAATAATSLAGAPPAYPEADTHAQRVMLMGVMTSGYVHDLNNLLMIIGSGASLAEDEVPADHPSRAHLADIQRAIQSASTITRQLLAFVRRQPPRRQAVDLGAVIRSYLPIGALVVGRQIKLSASVEPELWSVRADPVQIEQLLLNLLTNARNAMPDGGSVRITAANIQRERARPGRGGDYVRLTVADSGVGIRPEVAERLFEPFFSGDGSAGFGLGLAICNTIVCQLGGAIEVESEAGHGAAFHIYLPRPAAADDDGSGGLEHIA